MAAIQFLLQYDHEVQLEQKLVSSLEDPPAMQFSFKKRGLGGIGVKLRFLKLKMFLDVKIEFLKLRLGSPQNL